MSIRSWIQLAIMGLIIIAVNSMKHWPMLILSDVINAEQNIQSVDTTFYIILSYMCFFYGLLFGSWIWGHLSNLISNATAILISLLLIGIANYLQTFSSEFKYLCTFRFIIGAVTNIQKLGKAFVHDFIEKKNRRQAFQVENVSYVLGSIVAPFIGYYLYNTTMKSFSYTAFIISAFIIFLGIIFYIVFVMYPIAPQEVEEDEERLGIIKIPTMVEITFRSMLIHCFHSNVYVKYIIFTYIINSACFHVEFVLTSIYFTSSDMNPELNITKDQLAEANLIGSIPSLILIMFLYKIVPDLMTYKTYILTTITLSVLTTISTPIVRYVIIYHIGQNSAKTVLCAFYGIKMLFNYYTYTNALVKEITTSVFKVYRSNILNVVTMVKLLASALLFNFAITVMYFFMRNSDYRIFEPYNHFAPFIVIASLQILSIFLLEKSRFKKKAMF